MIDPILPLSISIAEGKGVYAFFLGSGVSMEAGIPTGSDIFWETIRLIRHDGSQQTDDIAQLADWLKTSEYANYTYANILQALFPSIGERHQFLAKHFAGQDPGPSHRAIAEMVAKGFIKVIITTNFDPLMERALDERKLPYCVVASDEDVQNATPVEHSNCWIIKLHGDYQRQSIRNTPSELASLAPAIASKFKEIADRYGLVVIGYAGADEGVMSVLRNRFPRYTLYWLSRSGNVNADVKSLITNQDGRIMQDRNASSFLSALMRRVESYAVAPGGDTVNDVIRLVRTIAHKNDTIMFKDELKRRQKYLAQSWPEIYEKFKPAAARISIEEMTKIAVGTLSSFSEYADGLLGMCLVILEYNRLSWLDDLLQVFQYFWDMFENIDKQPGSHWSELEVIPIAYAGFMWWVMCSYAINNQQWTAVKKLCDYRVYRYSERSSIALKDYKSFTMRSLWTHYQKEALRVQTQKEFIFDFFQNNERFRESLIQANFILGLLAVKEGSRFQPWFRLFSYYEGLSRAADTLKHDFIFTSALAEHLFGETYDIFTSEFAKRCDELYTHFSQSYLLETDSPRNIFATQPT